MPEPDSINNPHDRFVRRLLSNRDHVRELVSWQLPAEVVKALDIGSIKPAKESFVDSTLHEGVSDLVFEVKMTTGNDAYVVMLFEHKSTVDESTAFQVLRYMVQINEHRLRQGKAIACVIPMVFYHGRRPWTAARSMNEMLEVPEALRCYVPEFTIALLDLSQVSDEELRRESLLFANMLLLKYILRDELPERLPEMLKTIRKLLTPSSAMEDLETVIRYLASGTERITATDLENAVKQAIHIEGESIMPTIAQHWKQQGIEKGIEQGIEKGLEQGIEKGKLIGRIQALEEASQQTVSSDESLHQQSIDELRARADELSASVRRHKD